MFDDAEEEPLWVLILRPVKDKVAGSAVTRSSSRPGPGWAGRVGVQTVSRTHTHTLQTEPTDRAADQTQPVNEGHVGVWVTLRAALTLLAFDHVG